MKEIYSMNEVLNNTNLKCLTAREKEVLDYLMMGFHNAEIARELDISSHTAKAHISSILRKFGVNSRTSAVRIAFMEILNNIENKS